MNHLKTTIEQSFVQERTIVQQVNRLEKVYQTHVERYRQMYSVFKKTLIGIGLAILALFFVTALPPDVQETAFRWVTGMAAAVAVVNIVLFHKLLDREATLRELAQKAVELHNQRRELIQDRKQRRGRQS